MKTTTLAVLFLAAFAVSTLAQTPYIETFEVRLHNLDVVVTDRQGRPVRDLTKDDFLVLENGVPQPITNFSPYATGGTRSTADDTIAQAPQAAPPPPRRYVFFIDEIEMPKTSRQRVLRDLQEFLATMRDGDLAAVVRPTAKEKVLQEFTGDRAAIERAIKEAIDANALGFHGLTHDLQQLRLKLNRLSPRPVDAEIDTIRREYAFAVRRRVEHRLGQLRALTSSLAAEEGRKILVVVTAGLSIKPGNEAIPFEQELGIAPEAGFASPDDMVGGGLSAEPEAAAGRFDDGGRVDRSGVVTRDHRGQLDDIARTAAANGVTIYAVEPELRLDLGVRGGASVRGAAGPVRLGGHYGPDRMRDLLSDMQSDLLGNSAATLDVLTETTGGKWFRGSAGMDNTLRQIERDLSTYYSLAYRATGSADRPRKVEVRVRNRPELHVRTRTDVVEKSTDREMGDLVAATLIYPRPVNELAIQVTAGPPARARGYFTVPLDVVIPLEKLTFLPNGERWVASFDVHFAAAGQARDFMSGGKQEQLVELTAEQYAHRGATRYRYKTGINVSPGATKIAVGVLDNATKLTGFGTVTVETR